MSTLAGVAAGLLVAYVLLVGALFLTRPDRVTLRDVLRLLPDLARLVKRLADDRSLPRSVRARLWLLLAYLAMPFDLIPDVIPAVGYADDAILVALVLRSVVRGVGVEPLAHHWPGTPAGLRAVEVLAGLRPADPACA